MATIIYDPNEGQFIDKDTDEYVFEDFDGPSREYLRKIVEQYDELECVSAGHGYVEFHNPNYRDGDNISFSAHGFEDPRMIEEKVKSYQSGTYDPYEKDRALYAANGVPAPDYFGDKPSVDYDYEIKNYYLEKTGLDDPTLRIEIDDAGYAHIYSGYHEIAKSDQVVESKADVMRFVSNQVDTVKDYSTSHNEALFSGENFDNTISFHTADGEEHKVTLNSSEMEEYLKLSEQDRIKYLKNKSLGKFTIDKGQAEKSNIFTFYDLDGNELCTYTLSDEEYEIAVNSEGGIHGYMRKKYNVPSENECYFEGDEKYDKISVSFTNDLGEKGTYTFTSEECYKLIDQMSDNDLVEYLGKKDFEPVKIEKEFDRENNKIKIIYIDKNGRKETKVFDMYNPDSNLTDKFVRHEYKTNTDISNIDSSKHIITFDDGRTIELTDEQYAEYIKQGSDYLMQFPAYKESMITTILNNTFEGSFDVRREMIDGKEYYLIISGGEIIKKIPIDEITNDEGSIDAKKLVDLVQEDTPEDKLNRRSYDQSARFEFSKYLISFDDEQEYKSIVSRLKSTCSEITGYAGDLNGISGELSFSPGSASALSDVASSLTSVAQDADYLESAVDKTVNIYRSCDSDLRDVFESGIIDDIFRKAGLFVYDKQKGIATRNESDHANRLNIHDKETYLGILHDAATKYETDLKQMAEDWKRWNDKGWKIDEETYKRLCKEAGGDPFNCTDFNDFMKKYEGYITPTIISSIAGTNKAGLSDKQIEEMEERYYNCLKAPDGTTPSDYDKYTYTAAVTLTPEGIVGINNIKNYIQHERYFSVALSDTFADNLDYIRKNAEAWTDDDWAEYIEKFGLDSNVALIKNTPPYQLAMLQTLGNYDYAQRISENYAELSDERLLNQKIEFLKTIDPNFYEWDKNQLDAMYYGKNYADYFGNNWEDEINSRYNEFLSRFNIRDGETALFDYEKYIIGDSVRKRKAREAGMNELSRWNDGNIPFDALCQQFASSLVDNTVGGIANLMDPSYMTLLSENAYKTQYMLDLIADSRNPQNVALKYSKGEISENQYKLLQHLSTIGIKDDLGNTITNSYSFMEVAGKITGSLLLAKISQGSKAMKYAIKALKALNKGGKTSASLYGKGIDENSARWLGLINAGTIFAESAVLGNLASKIWPELPDKGEMEKELFGESPEQLTDNIEQAALEGSQIFDMDIDEYASYADKAYRFIYDNYDIVSKVDQWGLTELRNYAEKSTGLSNPVMGLCVYGLGTFGGYEGGQAMQVLDPYAAYRNTKGVDLGKIGTGYMEKNIEKAGEELQKLDISRADQGYGLEYINDVFLEEWFKSLGN